MKTLPQIVKGWKESAAVHTAVNLFGFIDDTVFLTKSGDVGLVLRVHGRDYESLDTAHLDYICRRAEAAVKSFDSQFAIYQYVIKRDGTRIPRQAEYHSALVEEAVAERVSFLEGRAGQIYTLECWIVLIYTGARYEQELKDRIRLWLTRPFAAMSAGNTLHIIDDQIARGAQALRSAASTFVTLMREHVPVEIVEKEQAFAMFRRLLNFDQALADGVRLKHGVHIDYFAADSSIECHRDHLRIGDYYTRVLTLKDPPPQTRANFLRELLELKSQFFISSEFRRIDNYAMRKAINTKRRHFFNKKTSGRSQLTEAASKERVPESEKLIDASAVAVVDELNACLTEMEVKGTYFGQYTLTIVLYDTDPKRLRRSVAAAITVAANADAAFHEERYNLLNAYYAALPGGNRYNLRMMFLSNRNHADMAFWFLPQIGEPQNEYLQSEYLAVLETMQGTPYYLNLHYRDVGSSIVLGMTGSGKSFFCNFLLTHAQKYNGLTFIFDIGGSYRALTHQFGGSYLSVDNTRQAFQINPFTLPPTDENFNFLFLFVKLLIESEGKYTLDNHHEKEIFEQIKSLYMMEPELRRLSSLCRILPRELEPHLSRWLEGGRNGHLFDNVEDTLTFARFQTFDFEALRKFPDILEPLLFYVLQRAFVSIDTDSTLKLFLVEEAWRFFKNATVKNFVAEAFKTWRKKNACMILATQSADDLTQTDILAAVVESCASMIFLANPHMDRERYRTLFHLNEREVELIASLTPKKEIFVKRPDLAKKVQLNVGPRELAIYSNTVLQKGMSA